MPDPAKVQPVQLLTVPSYCEGVVFDHEGRGYFYKLNGETYDPPGFHKRPHGGDADMSQVHFRGLIDPTGRLSGVATHNTDITNGWEREGEDEEFFKRFSIKAYALAINVITYAMSN